MTDLLTEALRLAELGYRVFPCWPNTKKPITSRGLNDATTDADAIRRWWEHYPLANVGLSTDGLLVVDVDPHKDGSKNEWLSDQPERAMQLAACPLAITPRGGKHYVYQCAGARNSTSKLAPNVDVRATGGYILVAPSIVNGRPLQVGNAVRVRA